MKLFIAVVLLFGVSPAQQCLVGWTQRPNTNFCYLYKATPKSYSAAMDDCTSYNGVISNVGDQAEQDFIAGLITSQTSDVWIGFSDGSRHEGIWIWLYEPCKTYLNWDAGQPSYGNGGKDCAVMKSSQASSHRWDDRACTNLNAYVCKTNLDGTSMFDLASFNMECYINCLTKFPAGTCIGIEYRNNTCIYEIITYDHTSNGVNTSYIACTTELPPQPTTDAPSTTTTTDATTVAAAHPTTAAAAPPTTAAAAPPTTAAAVPPTTAAAAPATTRPQGGKKNCKKRQ
ncbi:uncharacterized protein LOC131948396 [Physella acuta]|uniref:uncharacterized protein LOC131948396 n=1 Tax=Physella acuta TaxID=109671 RepID=UPI0027DC3C57|nr:uncharacterized protein LOC131948396 [Physella acuta]